MNLTDVEIIERAKKDIEFLFSVIIALDQPQRAALHIVFQCAERAHNFGDLAEATQIYQGIASELLGIFSDLPYLPQYVPGCRLPVSVGRWFTPDMVHLANMATTPPAPDRAAKLVYLILPAGRCAEIVGDLDEEYRTHVLPRFGRSFARRWYWKQTITTILHYLIVSPALAGVKTFQQVITDILVKLIQSLFPRQ
jgi:hypothetical protein